MAARFHHPPQSHRPARRRAGLPALLVVPDRLAPVLPMPRPAARPSRLVVLSCGPCGLTGDPAPAGEVEQAAGSHDDQHHDGTPTAELHTVHTLRSPRATGFQRSRPAAGPDLGGAA